MVAVGVKLVCIIMYIFYFMSLLWGTVLPAKVNDSMIIRNCMILGNETMSGDPQQNGDDLQDSL